MPRTVTTSARRRSRARRPSPKQRFYTDSRANSRSVDPPPSDVDEALPSRARLRVRANGSIKRTLMFLAELRRNASVHLLKIVPDQKQDLEVWLRLSSPARLKEDLTRMSTVSRVAGPRSSDLQGPETVFSIQLTKASSIKPETGVVMVVEDAPDFQSLVVSMLSVEQDVKDVYVACSGEDAIEAFEGVNPELVLLDFRLPGINGLETAKRMKSKHPKVKIALLTAFADEVLERAVPHSCIEVVIPKMHFSLARIKKLLGRDA